MTNLSFVLESTRTAPEQARRAIRGCFGETLPATTLHDLEVVMTELVANAVEHGPAGEIEVRISVDEEGHVCGEVCDQGTDPIRIPPPAAQLDDGLGLRSWMPSPTAGARNVTGRKSRSS